MSTQNPVVQGRRLRAELRRARLEAALTQDEVARALEWSLSKLIRIEAGSVAISANDLRAVLQLYRVEDTAQVSELLGLARGARERTWWSQYRDVLTPADLTYLENESAATVIRMFHAMAIPGLLQVEDYARAVFRNDLVISSDQVERRIEALMKQQALLGRADPPQIRVVLDEGVIRRLVGGPDTMRSQLQHLLDAARRQPDISLQVLPFAVGAVAALQGSFVQLEFPDDLDSVVWTENDRSLDGDPERMAHYLENFMELERLALDSEDSAAVLERIVGELFESDSSDRPASPDLADDLDHHFVL